MLRFEDEFGNPVYVREGLAVRSIRSLGRGLVLVQDDAGSYAVRGTPDEVKKEFDRCASGPRALVELQSLNGHKIVFSPEVRILTVHESSTLGISILSTGEEEYFIKGTPLEIMSKLHPVKSSVDVRAVLQGAWDYSFSNPHGSHDEHGQVERRLLKKLAKFFGVTIEGAT